MSFPIAILHLKISLIFDVVPAVSAFKPTGAVIKECMSENQETLENEMEMYGGSEQETSADDTELVGLFKNMLI